MREIWCMFHITSVLGKYLLSLISLFDYYLTGHTNLYESEFSKGYRDFLRCIIFYVQLKEKNFVAKKTFCSPLHFYFYF